MNKENKPKFDPNKPFEVVGSTKPKFDPNKPFEVVPETTEKQPEEQPSQPLFDPETVAKYPQAKQNFDRYQDDKGVIDASILNPNDFRGMSYEDAAKVGKTVKQEDVNKQVIPEQSIPDRPIEQSFSQPYLSFEKDKHPYDLPTKSLPKSQFDLDYVNTRNEILTGQTKEQQAETISENIPIQTTIEQPEDVDFAKSMLTKIDDLIKAVKIPEAEPLDVYEKNYGIYGGGVDLGNKSQNIASTTKATLEKAKDYYEAVANGDANAASKFWSGLKTIDLENTLSLGIKGMANSIDIYNAATNYSAGTATPEEENLLVAKSMLDEIQSIAQKDRAISVGSGLAEMAPWLAQFAVTGGLGTGVAKATTSVLGKTLASKVAGRLVGSAAQTAAQVPMMVQGTAERMTDRYQVQNGELVQAEQGEGFGEALLRTYANNYLENVSERLVGDVADKLARKGVNAFLKSKTFGKTPVSDLIQWTRKNPYMKLTNRTLGLNTPLSENIEEAFTGLTQPFVTEDNWKDIREGVGDYFTAETLYRTFLTTAAMGASMGGAQFPFQVYNVTQSEQGRKLVEDGFDDKAHGLFYGAATATTVEEREKYFKDLVKLTGLTKKEMNPVMHYYQTVLSQIENGIDPRRQPEIIQPEVSPETVVDPKIHDEIKAKTEREILIDQKIAEIQDDEGNITKVVLDGQEWYVKNSQDLGKPGWVIFIKNGSETKAVKADKLPQWTKQTPEEVKTDIANEDAFIEAEKQKHEAVINKAAENGIVVGAEIENEFGTGTVTNISKEGVITAQDEEGKISTSTLEETVPVIEKPEPLPGAVNLDELSSEDAFIELSKTDPKKAELVLRDDIEEAKSTIAELNKSKKGLGREERANILQQISVIQAEIDYLENKYFPKEEKKAKAEEVKSGSESGKKENEVEKKLSIYPEKALGIENEYPETDVNGEILPSPEEWANLPEDVKEKKKSTITQKITDNKGNEFPVDYNIAPFLKRIFKLNINTGQSDSGTVSDHPGHRFVSGEKVNQPVIGGAYITFWKPEATQVKAVGRDINTQNQIDVIRQAAKNTGWVAEDKQVFFQPSLSLYLPNTKDGTGRSKILEEANELTDEKYPGLHDKDFMSWLDKRNDEFEPQVVEKHGGEYLPTDKQVLDKWNDLVTEIERLSNANTKEKAGETGQEKLLDSSSQQEKPSEIKEAVSASEKEIPVSEDGLYQIYQVKVKNKDGEIEQLYGVPSPLNKGQRGFGDDLVNTLEQAIKTSEYNRFQEGEIAKRNAEREEQKRKDEEAAQAKKESQKGKTQLEIMNEAKDAKILDVKMNYDGVIQTRREHAAAVINSGGYTGTAEVNKVKDVSRTAYNRMDGRQQEDLERRIREGGKKTEYRLYTKDGSFYEVTKAEYDYAKSIEEKPKAEEEYQKPIQPVEPAKDETPSKKDWKTIVLDYFGGMYEDVVKSNAGDIYDNVNNIPFADAVRVYNEIKAEFEAEKLKSTNNPLFTDEKPTIKEIADASKGQIIIAKPGATPQQPTYGANNKIFTEDAAAKAREILKRKLGNLNSGLDPEMMIAGIQLAGYHVEAGARKFSEYAKVMIEDIGEGIKPYLKSFYNSLRTWPGFDNTGMDSSNDVDNFDLDKKETSSNPFVDNVYKESISKSDIYEIEYKNFAGKSFKDKVKFNDYDGTLISFTDTETGKDGALFPKDVISSKLLEQTTETATGNKAAFIGSIKSKLGVEKLNIVSIRKIAAENGFNDIKDTTLQEYVELAIISKAKDIVNQDISQDEKYRQIVELYNSQPTISMRSSERIEKQQYSTPLPMSFLAGEFVNAINPQSLLEPSAGNGMMVFNVNPNIVIANEIDVVRLENLQEQGFKEVTNQDGTTEFNIDKVDAVITNPPFGKSDARDYNGYKISGLDEQMVVNALLNLSETGRASIIIGGHTKYKSNGTLAGEKAFFNYLYNFYNVSDVINMDGGLYSKQGTSYPTRLILINGKRTETERVYAPLEKDTNTEIVTTFDELKQRVNKANNENTILQPSIPERNNNGTGSRSGNGSTSTSQGTETINSNGETAGSNQSGNGQTGNAGNANRPGGTTRPNDGNGRNTDVVDGNQRNDEESNTESNTGTRTKDTSQLLNRPDELAGNKIEVDLAKEKTPYPARSKSQQIGSVVPTNVAQTLSDVLSVFKDIDEYVRVKLGYESKDELFNALAAEQIDSVAMAIYQIENGGALIIGDMTGVGKGRQAASILRYAHLQGKKPIFVTEKAHLFSDIFRDLRDIGSANLIPFIFNSKSQNSDPTIVDEFGSVVYAPLSEAVKRPIFQSGRIPEKYDYAVLTYSQLNAGQNKPSAKKAFFASIAQDNILILDESHNAGGDGNTGTFMTNMLPSTKGVVFLSGTFAKRADNMPIYALKTSMSETNMSNAELIEAIKTGGVPLQEIMSKNLTQSGQMIRRERDFTGVHIDWKTVEDSESHFKAYDSIIKVFNDLIQFQREFIDPVIEDMNAELAGMQGEADNTTGTADLGINNVPFASKTFNLTRQLLFALKAKNIAEEAIEELKNGRRPVIAVANTMEGFMNELGEVGEKISNFDFSTTLMRGLDGLFRFTETDGMGEHTNDRLSVSDLSPEGQEKYYEIQDFIRNMSVGISISPIDIIKDAIQKAGYSIGEMTGRTTELIFNPDGTATIQKRTNTDKKKLTREFNNGKIDALIMNQSASTGISLHASEKVADQRQRIMLSAQTQLDVNTEVQMRGRIDRTGQVVRGAYRYILSPIPAEQRMTMMFKVKLKSLDANTTSSQKSKTNEIEIVDFLNKYGDKICVEHLKEDPELNEKLLDPMKLEGKSDADIESFVAPEGAALKIAGRVALLPIHEQQKFYDEITEKYNALINYLNDTNSNDLEITTLPLRAETKEKVVVVQGRGGSNPFAQDSFRETVEIDVLKKPLKAEEIKKEIERHTEGLSQNEYRNSLIEKLNSYTEKLIESETEKSNKDFNSKEQARIKKANKIFDKQEVFDADERRDMMENYLNSAQNIHERNLNTKIERIRRRSDGVRRVFNMFPVGMVIMIPNTSDVSINTTYSNGVLMGYKVGNKMNPSTITAIFATLDSRRKIEVPLSKIDFLNAAYAESMQMRGRMNTTLDNWDSKIPTRNRRTGYIVTGNILQAFASVKGQLIAYTDIDGNIKEGILLPENYDAGEQQMRVQIIQKLEEIRNGRPFTDITGNVRIGRQYNGGYALDVPLSKQSGGMYFLDEGLRNLVIGRDFRQMGGRMVGAITEGNLENVLQYMSEKFNTSVNVDLVIPPRTENNTQTEEIEQTEPEVTEQPEVKPIQETPETPEKDYTKAGVLLPVEPYTHTKTGEKLFNVKLNGRVSKDDFERIKYKAKFFKPVNSQKAFSPFADGFLFYTEEDANKFKESIERQFGEDEVRFRILGETGAANLDKAEEATTRLDNLKVAKEMETSGKDAKQILLATGWQRGTKDNKWKYEVPDIDLNFTFDEAVKHLLNETLTLSDVVNDTELFKAYPELKNTKIQFYEKKPFGSTGGTANSAENTIRIVLEKGQRTVPELGSGRKYIALYANDGASLKSVLSHEIQHLIQGFEGFARGGNPNTVLAAIIGDRIRQLQEVQGLEEVTQEQKDEIETEVYRQYPERYRAYQKLSAEVEARNIQRRIDFSPEERRDSLLTETEDVATKDQIYLREGIESAMTGLWHGSPHKFGKFSTQYMGTGEGAQAYGWGLYYTDKRSIAEGYAKSLSQISEKDINDGKEWAKKHGITEVLGERIASDLAWLREKYPLHTKTKTALIDMAYYEMPFIIYPSQFEKYGYNSFEEFKEVLDRIFRDVDILSELVKTPNRNLYKVKIHGDKTIEELNFLRWDKPLSEQSKAVKDALEKKFSLPSFNEDFPTAADFYRGRANKFNSDRKASEELLALGIDGIQYPSEYTTKGQHEDSFNYVVFDENAVEIEDAINFKVDPKLDISDKAQPDVKDRKNALNALEALVKQFGVPITVIHSSELSDVVGLAAKRKKGTPVAFYHNGTAYIISDKIQSVSDTKQSYLHEAIIHKGLDLLFNAGPVTVLGKKYNTKNELLDEVFNRLSPELITEIASQYTDGKTETPKQQREIAEEALAKLNELDKTPSRLEVFMDSLWKFIKKLVGFSSKQFTRTELHKMLADHRKMVKKAARGGITESSDKKLNSTLDFFARLIPQTETANFKKWFKNSKVVDENGKPLVVYHGTTDGGFDSFSHDTKGKRTNHSPEDVGFHFTNDKEYASAYSLEYRKVAYPILIETLGYIPEASKAPDGAMTYEVYLSIQNPMIIQNAIINKDVIERAIKNGHDGIIGKVGEKTTEYVVFTPTQIKSATGNNGNFDENDPNINFRFRSKDPEVNKVLDNLDEYKKTGVWKPLVPPKTTVTEPTEPKGGRTVEKTIVTERTYKGDFSDAVDRELEKIGLTRETENQKEAEQVGLKIIEMEGLEGAMNRVRSGEIGGAPAGAIWHEKLKDIDSKMNAETNPEMYDLLAKEYADITEEMGSAATKAGQFSAFFAYIYKTSDLGFNAERLIRDYKKVNNGEISPELEEKFKKLAEDYKDVQEKLAAEILKVEELKEQAAVEAIKASIERQSRKKAKASEKIREKTDKLIELIDLGKINRPGIFAAATPGSLAWDLALETVRTAVKATGRTIEAIAKGFEAIKSTDWYKNLDANKQKQAKNAYFDYFTAETDKKEKEEKETPTYQITKKGLKIPHSVIRDLVEQGFDNIEDLTQAVYDVIVEDFPEITIREVRDAITGYGETMSQNQEEIEREIRKMKDLGRVISGLEDVSEGERPKKSGLQRDKPDPDVRAAHKQLREAMKLLPVDEQRRLDQQKTQLDAAKQRLINQIEDLQREIDKGELTPKNARTMQEDEELRQLKAARDAKKAEHDAIFNDEDFLNKKRVELTKKAVNRRIAELERRISEGDFAPKAKKELIADTELIKLRAEKLRIQEEYKKEMHKAKLRNRTQAEKIKDGLWDAWGITRALRATGEFSFVGIQGLINTIAHPIQAKQAFKTSMRFLTSQRKADEWMNTLKAQDYYPMLKESKLAITEPNAELTAREELFYSGWTDMIWNNLGKILGKNPDTWMNYNPLRAIERAAVGYLDTQRVLRYLDGVEMLKEKGLEFNNANKEAYKEMADVINTFTGRGSIGRLDPDLLTKIFFSPRNWSSVIKTATPYAFYHFGKKRAGADAWKPSVAQKMALADFSKFVGLTTSLVALAALALNGDDDDENKVELDPRSTDFGKIKIGDTRIDPWGGRIQQIVLISRLISGDVKNSYGEVFPTGTPYKSPTGAELLFQMATNKLAPSASILYKHLSAKIDADGNKVDTFGEPYSLPGAIKENLYPIYWETLSELAKDDITALDGLLAVYSFFGGGVNVYDQTPEKKTERTLKEQTLLKAKFNERIEAGYKLTEDDKPKYNQAVVASRIKQQYVVLKTRATRYEKEGNEKAAERIRQLVEDSKIKLNEADYDYKTMFDESERLKKIIKPEED